MRLRLCGGFLINRKRMITGIKNINFNTIVDYITVIIPSSFAEETIICFIFLFVPGKVLYLL